MVEAANSWNRIAIKAKSWKLPLSRNPRRNDDLSSLDYSRSKRLMHQAYASSCTVESCFVNQDAEPLLISRYRVLRRTIQFVLGLFTRRYLPRGTARFDDVSLVMLRVPWCVYQVVMTLLLLVRRRYAVIDSDRSVHGEIRCIEEVG